MFSSFGHHVAKHFSRSKLLLQSTRTRTRTAPARTITSSTNKNNQEKNEENVPPSVGGERARPVRTTYMLERLAPWFGWFLIVWTVWVTYRGYTSEKWEKTTAKVERVKGLRFGNLALVMVKYSYQDPYGFDFEDSLIEGNSDLPQKRFEGSTYAIGTPLRGYSILRYYPGVFPPKDEDLTIYYDPQRRSHSTILPGIIYPYFNAFVLILGFTIFFTPFIPRAGPRMALQMLKK